MKKILVDSTKILHESFEWTFLLILSVKVKKDVFLDKLHNNIKHLKLIPLPSTLQSWIIKNYNV